MGGGFLHGRLEAPTSAPAEGERVGLVAKLPGVTIEQVLSGRLVEPVSFDQRHDEWVLVVEGGAKLVVDGAEVQVRAGDWLLLPAHCAHSVVETQPGTSWLAVHAEGA